VSPLAGPPCSIIADGYVTGTGAPSAPFIPVPATSFTLCSFTSGDASMNPAMLEPPAVVALPDANVTFSISTAAVTPLITSAGALPAGATFTVCVAGEYAHVPPPQLNPPYTVADDALEPTVTADVYVPLHT